MSGRTRSPELGRTSAAVLGAPGAALLVAVALPAVIPASTDVRYLIACVAVVPLMATAPCLALLSRSATRAWTGSLVAAASAALVIWRSWS